MKSLSPNAQEFVPLSIKNQNLIHQQPIQTYYMDPNSMPFYNIGYQNLGLNYQLPSNYQIYPSNQMFHPPLGPFNSSHFSQANKINKNQAPRKPSNKYRQKEAKKGEKSLNFNANEFPALTSYDKPTPISTIDMAKLNKANDKNFYLKKNEENSQALSETPQALRSFKDAVLVTKEPITNNQQKQNEQNLTNTKQSNKKKSKKISKKESKISPKDDSNETKLVEKNFILNVNEFPDLDSSQKSDSNKYFIEEKQLSDAYSSDATLDANIIKLRTNSQKSEDGKQTKPNLKKIHQPLTIEFANMISALQKGQNFQRNSQLKIQAKAVANILSIRQEKGTTMQLVNPLDSSSTVKRGKEREKPKSKKKSTLKKIILKEREEKRKIRDELEKSDHFDDNSSLPNLSILFASPKADSTVLNDADEGSDKDKSDYDESDVNNEILSPISQPSPISINGYNPSPYAALDFSDSPISLEKLEEQVKKKIHSRKFREYCNQIISRDIDEICLTLLQEISRFQDRLYQKFPNKAKNKRRFVMGIREVTKHLKLQKIKCVIIAPNCEKIESKGGLDDAINTIIQIAMEQNIPFLFALGRKDLGKAVKKLVPISVIGIFDYSGAEEHFKRLVELANNAKLAYQDMVEDLEKEECENFISQPKEKTENFLSTGNFMPKIPSHMAHSRTPSNGSNISIDPIYHMNYHTHSRSASGNFNYGHTTLNGGHSRTASGGGIGAGGLNLDLLVGSKNWTHSRTPSNCSNNSFMSRVSEPISEINYDVNSAQAAVQFYSEQVRQEMKENDHSNPTHFEEASKNDEDIDNEKMSASLSNLHLGCINEIDAGNEADTEEK